jgi:DnaJ homolog subfamily C member 30
MIYHPDKNENSEEAADKFRQITEAYEVSFFNLCVDLIAILNMLHFKVLGNFRLKKLYDKGIIHTASDKFRNAPREEPVEDDSTTRFYKAREHRHKPTATGRTPIYDFDEWTRNHYSATFNAEQVNRAHQVQRDFNAQKTKSGGNSEFMLFGSMIGFMIIIAIYTGVDDSLNDSPKKKN